MLTSLALIFLVGLSAASICQTIRIPRIIGMLFTGMLLGPYALDLLDSNILLISADLRKLALIIILIKAGFSLNIQDLKRVGRPAMLLSFLPALSEIGAILVFAPMLLNVEYKEAAVMGAVLAAVSPAVVVPRMVMLIEKRYGTEKSIPQMILAGASLDDVFVIVLFATFCSIAQGGSASLADFVSIPVSIVLGILLGIVSGIFLSAFFETAYAKKHLIRNSFKTIVVLGSAFLMIAIEDTLKPFVAVSGLLAVMSMTATMRIKSAPVVTKRLSEKFGKLWLAAEVILFVLVGAAVDVRYTFEAGPKAVLLILLALFVRSFGTCICTLKTDLTFKERLFVVLSYLPKATVQAAIGSVPLGLGLPCGRLVLSVAVLSILITAPLGAFGMDLTYKKLLNKDSSKPEISE